jgi:hypothetical protein
MGGGLKKAQSLCRKTNFYDVGMFKLSSMRSFIFAVAEAANFPPHSISALFAQNETLTLGKG